MIKLLFLFFAHALANESLTVNGQVLNIERIASSNHSINSAFLSDRQSIKVGRNTFSSLPPGTNVSFFPNSGVEDRLVVRGFIVTEKIKDQKIELAGKKVVHLNCGRIKSSVAFVEFDRSGELLNGCRVATDQALLPPGQTQKIVVHKFSPVRFLSNGLLKSARAASGTIELQNNQIDLLPKSSIKFHANENLHFFQPNWGERFLLRTEISEQTEFFQSEDSKLFPVVLHPNGQLSTGWLHLKIKLRMRIKAFGADVDVDIQQGPIGFDLLGKADRLVLSNITPIKVTEPTYIRSTEKSTGAISRGLLKVGTDVILPARTQLFLTQLDNQAVLTGYPEFGQLGLIFFNELSQEPFEYQMATK